MNDTSKFKMATPRRLETATLVQIAEAIDLHPRTIVRALQGDDSATYDASMADVPVRIDVAALHLRTTRAMLSDFILGRDKALTAQQLCEVMGCHLRSVHNRAVHVLAYRAVLKTAHADRFSLNRLKKQKEYEDGIASKRKYGAAQPSNLGA